MWPVMVLLMVFNIMSYYRMCGSSEWVHFILNPRKWSYLFKFIYESEEQENLQAELFTTEFLNDIKCSRIPNHYVKLKVGVPIMLLINIDQANGLCNGTRL